MKELTRLIDEGASDLQLRLIRGACDEQPSPELQAAMLAPLGGPSGGPVAESGGATTAATHGARGGVGTSASLQPAAASGLAAVWKYATIGLVAAGAAGAGVWLSSGGSQPTARDNDAVTFERARAADELDEMTPSHAPTALPETVRDGGEVRTRLPGAPSLAEPTPGDAAKTAVPSTNQPTKSAGASPVMQNASRTSMARPFAVDQDEVEQPSPATSRLSADAVTGVVAGDAPGQVHSEQPATLKDELHLLDRARSAIKGGHAQRALELLELYSARFPQGTLSHEATVLTREAKALH